MRTAASHRCGARPHGWDGDASALLHLLWCAPGQGLGVMCADPLLPCMTHRLQEAAAREEEAACCTAVAGMRSAIAEQTAANEERRARLAEVQERVAKLRVSAECMGTRRWRIEWLA